MICNIVDYKNGCVWTKDIVVDRLCSRIGKIVKGSII